jgi:hypothetical protein
LNHIDYSARIAVKVSDWWRRLALRDREAADVPLRDAGAMGVRESIVERRALEIVFVAMALVCMAFFSSVWSFGQYGTFIQGDGRGYYSWVRSVVFDHDVDFTNELGGPRNKCSVGLALIETTPVVVARIVDYTLGSQEPSSAAPGWGALYQWSVALFLSMGGLACVYVAFREIVPKSTPRRRWVAGVLALATFGATNLVEYATRGISYTHLTDVALVCVIWRIGCTSTFSRPRLFVIGLLTALLIVVRYTNVLVVPWLLVSAFAGKTTLRKRDAFWLTAGSVPPPCAQLLANYAVSKHLLLEPYPGEPFYWLHPRLWDSVFSLHRGWFVWHPWLLVLLLLTAASWMHYRKTREGRWTLAAAVLSVMGLWYVNSAWWAWDFGFSFGNRGFLTLLPVLTITVGQAAPTLFAAVRNHDRPRALRRLTIVVIALTLWNANLWVGFVLSATLGSCYTPTLAESARWIFTFLAARPWPTC